MAILVTGVSLASCGGDDSDAKKEAAKRARDQELVKLPYPASSGTRAASMESSYDGARDRTSITLRLHAPPVSGASVSSATLYLTSSHPGTERPPGNPEGSVDGSLVIRCATPGLLAYAGAPGQVLVDGVTTPLREAQGDDGYSSTRATGGAAGYEEIVRFRFPTELVVTGANSDGFTLAFKRLEVRITGAHLADFREFTSTLNPNK